MLGLLWLKKPGRKLPCPASLTFSKNTGLLAIRKVSRFLTLEKVNPLFNLSVTVAEQIRKYNKTSWFFAICCNHLASQPLLLSCCKILSKLSFNSI